MKNTNIKTVMVDIDKLKPAIYNPRTLSEEQERHLTESIKQFDLVDPIIANKYKGRENTVISGHQRLRVASKLGYKKVPVIYLELNEEQEKRLNLHMNHSTGSWSIEKLKELDIDLLVDIGFNDSELRDIWDDVLEIEDDDFNEEKELEKIK
ncbi:MAG: ParB N-terminal domain-containing protein, partial [Candidatus Paceibacterota bacterium]